MKKKLLAAVLCAVTAAVLLAGCGTSGEESPSDSVVSDETGAEGVHMFDILKHQEFTADPNTQDMIDQIEVTAQANADDLTDEQAEQMIYLLVQSNDEFYDGNNQMELYIWYGYLLTNKYDEGDLYNSLGFSLLSAVEPVYLGDAEVDDEEIQEALQGVDDLVAELYDEILSQPDRSFEEEE